MYIRKSVEENEDRIEYWLKQELRKQLNKKEERSRVVNN